MEHLMGLTVLAVHRDATWRRLSFTVKDSTPRADHVPWVFLQFANQELAIHDGAAPRRRFGSDTPCCAQYVPPGEVEGLFSRAYTLYTEGCSGETLAITEWVPGLVSRLSYVAAGDGNGNGNECISTFHEFENLDAIVGRRITGISRTFGRIESARGVCDSTFIHLETMHSTPETPWCPRFPTKITTIEFRVDHAASYSGHVEFAGEVVFAPSSAGCRAGLTRDAHLLAGVCIKHEDCLLDVELARACGASLRGEELGFSHPELGSSRGHPELSSSRGHPELPGAVG